MMSRVYQIFTAIVLAAVIILLGNEAWRQWYASIPPVDVLEYELLTPVVARGGELRMRFKIRVNRQCPANLMRFIIPEKGGIPYRYPELPGGFSMPGEHDNIIKAPIPYKGNPDTTTQLDDGKYIYRTVLVRYCAEGMYLDQNTPDIPFEIKGDAL